jgi:hypothetical protein
MRDRLCQEGCVDEAGGGIGCVNVVVRMRLDEGQVL